MHDYYLLYSRNNIMKSIVYEEMCSEAEKIFLYFFYFFLMCFSLKHFKFCTNWNWIIESVSTFFKTRAGSGPFIFPTLFLFFFYPTMHFWAALFWALKKFRLVRFKKLIPPPKLGPPIMLYIGDQLCRGLNKEKTLMFPVFYKLRNLGNL